MMKRTIFFVLTVAMVLFACKKQSGDQVAGAAKENATTSQSVETEAPPVLAVSVNGLPLFAPFNGGDIADGGRVLKDHPEKYTKYILNDAVYDVTYQGEKNKDLKEDDSYLNEYYFKIQDSMKGQLYSYSDPKAIEQHMKTHGDMTAEGQIIPQEYADGILVTADYLKGRSPLKVTATTTEAPGEPTFPSDVVANVEEMIGQKVEMSRIVYIVSANDKEYRFGVMRAKPNDQYGIAAWVLAGGDDVSVWTDTCEVVKEEHRVYWSSYDPDEYMEPKILAVLKGEKGFDIYALHMNTDETAHYFLMRQKGKKMERIPLGGFYQRLQ